MKTYHGIARDIRQWDEGKPCSEEEFERMVEALEGQEFESISDMMIASLDILSLVGEVVVMDDDGEVGVIRDERNGTTYTDHRENYGPWYLDEMREYGF